MKQGEREEDICRGNLRLSDISLHSFRNYDDVSLEDLGVLTILVGPNAVGKTSIIEAVQMMTALKSFRTNRYAQMTSWGHSRSSVMARLSGGGRNLDLRLLLDEGKRSYQLNGKPRRVQDLKGILPAVTFSPDDLDLAKGTHSIRRDALDGIGCQLSRNFYAVSHDYAKLIRQKNKALKDGLPDVYLDGVDDVLVRVGAQLMAHRLYILKEFKPSLSSFYESISMGREFLDFVYVPSWVREDVDSMSDTPGILARLSLDESTAKDQIAGYLSQAMRVFRSEERARGKAIVGPHADKLWFMIDGRNSLYYSSQGQQRSIVLAFKLAEASIITRSLDQKPILLLDDVMSELDAQRRQYFTQFILDDYQTIITTTSKEYFDSDICQHADVIDLPFRAGE